MYTLTLASGPLPASLRAAMRQWLRAHLLVPAIERGGDLWYLFDDPASRGASQRHLEREPGAPIHGAASVWLRDDAVEMETAREPETDRALYAFSVWAQGQAALQLRDGGLPIAAADLIDPELYE